MSKLCSEGNLEGILQQRRELWGHESAPAPTSSIRKKILWDFQSTFWDSARQCFTYHFRRPDAPVGIRATIVCEDAWLHLIGMRNSTPQFRANANHIKEGLSFDSGLMRASYVFLLFFLTLNLIYFVSETVKVNEKARNDAMAQSCKTFITWFRDTNCDQLPSYNNFTSGKKHDSPVWVMPFVKITQFHAEYEAYQIALGLDEIASYSTFRRVYVQHFSKSLRTMRCKGNFSHSCGICNGGVGAC